MQERTSKALAHPAEIDQPRSRPRVAPPAQPRPERADDARPGILWPRDGERAGDQQGGGEAELEGDIPLDSVERHWQFERDDRPVDAGQPSLAANITRIMNEATPTLTETPTAVKTGRLPRDLTGMQFLHLKVITEAEKSKFGERRWICECKCGKKVNVGASRLKSGKTKSCGCASLRHGHCVGGLSHEYVSWCNMKTRCLNKNFTNYHNYGGRGISICQRWLSFENFIEDMGPMPTKKHTLERIENDGNYEKTNCVWATRMEQANNRRSSHRLTHAGRTMTIQQWSREIGLNDRLISMRLQRGWSDERALTEDPRVNLPVKLVSPPN